MEVIITADKLKERRGYEGAILELPADKYTFADVLERARVPEGGTFQLSPVNWPHFLIPIFYSCGDNALEGANFQEINFQEINFLASKLQLMDRTELAAYEGILKLKEEADISHPLMMRDLVNALYNLDNFTFFPEVTNDYELGEICMMVEMQELIGNLPDEVYDLLDVEKTGALQRKNDQGTFTDKGYIYGKLEEWREVYDGKSLPWLPEEHSGTISLLLEKAGSENSGDIWLELPADEAARQEALAALGESTFDSCFIKKARGILPFLNYQLAGDEDIDKLNLLAERLMAFPDRHTLAKYKAVLELECCNDLDMELDIAKNLDCYEFDDVILSAEDYADYVLRETGIDTSDPAFACFDFKGYGERQLQNSGYVHTAYGYIGRNDQPFIRQYTKIKNKQTLQ
ncbi:antirestriction protein ArdA [Eisenbergiella sp.]